MKNRKKLTAKQTAGNALRKKHRPTRKLRTKTRYRGAKNRNFEKVGLKNPGFGCFGGNWSAAKYLHWSGALGARIKKLQAQIEEIDNELKTRKIWAPYQEDQRKMELTALQRDLASDMELLEYVEHLEAQRTASARMKADLKGNAFKFGQTIRQRLPSAASRTRRAQAA